MAVTCSAPFLGSWSAGVRCTMRSVKSSPNGESNGVSTNPGATALTRMPSGATSTATDLVKESLSRNLREQTGDAALDGFKADIAELSAQTGMRPTTLSNYLRRFEGNRDS